jgi:acyl-CoA hydrolase
MLLHGSLLNQVRVFATNVELNIWHQAGCGQFSIVAADADSKKGYSTYRPREKPRKQSNDRNYFNQGSRRDNDKYTPLTKPPISDSEEKWRKRRKRGNCSSSDSSDNEDKETGHWKSRGRHHEEEDEDISLPWRRQKVDAFTRRISDYSDDKRRRMPTNVKTYNGTGDPDDHPKIRRTQST